MKRRFISLILLLALLVVSVAAAGEQAAGEYFDIRFVVNGEEVYDSPVSTPTYTFSGLYANTDQNVVIRAVCGDGDTSMAVNGTFHTLCQNGNCQLVVAPSSTYSYSSYYNPSVAVYQNGSAISTGSDTRTVDICNGDSVIILVAQMPSSTYYTPSVRVTDVAGTDLFNASIAGRSVGDTLLAIARAGAGVNNIPLDVCTSKGIVVFNTPPSQSAALSPIPATPSLSVPYAATTTPPPPVAFPSAPSARAMPNCPSPPVSRSSTPPATTTPT